MANVFSAIEEYLRTVKSLGLLKYYILSYDDIASEKLPCESTNALKDLIHKLTTIMAESKSHQAVSMQDNDDSNINVETEVCKEKVIDSRKLSADDERLVQIRVDRNEMNRRISAFINRKRKEVDTINAKEFCNNALLDDDNPVIVEEVINSCARVDAVFVPRSGFKSHVKVSRVENLWGPQTYQTIKEEVDRKPNLSEIHEKSLEDIEERLKNMETHLKIKSENTIKRSIYSRLKDLEDRILFLEGISPDYFNAKTYIHNRSPAKRSKIDNPFKNHSVEDLQDRMKKLKEQLKLKSQQLSENSSQTRNTS